ncbi:MAG: hypothetical protein JO057_09700 [Chloroflexi bacterium]|nr:hypothetical protein [Chloroflexota bacterium]
MDITVKVSFPPILPLEELVITGGSGVLTVIDNLLTNNVQYVLEVKSGTRVNQPRIGEVVVASGKDSDGRTVAIPRPLATVSVGPPAIFRGPQA